MDPTVLLILLLVLVVVVIALASRRGAIDTNLILTVAVICLIVWLVWAVANGRIG